MLEFNSWDNIWLELDFCGPFIENTSVMYVCVIFKGFLSDLFFICMLLVQVINPFWELE